MEHLAATIRIRGLGGFVLRCLCLGAAILSVAFALLLIRSHYKHDTLSICTDEASYTFESGGHYLGFTKDPNGAGGEPWDCDIGRGPGWDLIWRGYYQWCFTKHEALGFRLGIDQLSGQIVIALPLLALTVATACWPAIVLLTITHKRRRRRMRGFPIGV
jgi:hypothetical protein